MLKLLGKIGVLTIVVNRSIPVMINIIKIDILLLLIILSSTMYKEVINKTVNVCIKAAVKKMKMKFSVNNSDKTIKTNGINAVIVIYTKEISMATIISVFRSFILELKRIMIISL